MRYPFRSDVRQLCFATILLASTLVMAFGGLPVLEAQEPDFGSGRQSPTVRKPVPNFSPTEPANNKIGQTNAQEPLAIDEARQDSNVPPIPPDLLFSYQPSVVRAEAHLGFPFGIGRISFRMRRGDEMLLRTGAVLLTERNNRVFYPVHTQSQFKSFLESLTGRQRSAPEDQHEILFLFKGEAPLELQLEGTAPIRQIVQVEQTRPNRFDRFLQVWWREYQKNAKKQMEWGDYPGVVETYVTAMLRKRLGFEMTRRQKKQRDELGQTLELLFDVETLRNDSVARAMEGLADNTLADRPLPPSIRWSPLTVENLPEEIPIEPFVSSIPEECFYLRFGTWQNQIWLQKLTEEFGGDLGRMISLRGYKPRIQSKFLDQLAIQSTEFDKLFGGRLIDDVAVIGMDAYFDEGATIGVMLHAKNTKALQGNLLNKRKAFARAHAKEQCEIAEITYRDHTIYFLSTPNNRYRSFYVVHQDNHLMATSLTLAKRFVDASEGDRSLAQTEEFRYARTIMPLEREDTIFVYLSTKFFQQLLSPKYQIELRRRNRVISDMQLLEAARLASSHEGLDFNDNDLLMRNGFLPAGFGQRPDNSQFIIDQKVWSDSIRGQRGFFTPIADMSVTSVSDDEHDWYIERAQFFTQNIQSLDPMVIGVKRYEHKDKKNVERVVFDARLAPFGEEKYGWLINRLGSTLKYQVASSPEDIISVQASLRREGNNRRDPVNHQMFAAVQDRMDPNVDLRPTSAFEIMRTLKEAPAYLGSWPKAGYLDFMPAIGGQPDEFGYTYSRFLNLWRLCWGEFAVVSFDRNRLEQLKPSLRVVESERPAQIRVRVGDLRTSRLKDWANAINYRRSWQTSVANARLLNMLTQQFGIAPEIAMPIAEKMLNVDLVCSLGGNYQIYELNSGRKLWSSDSWPSFATPEMPPNYTAPLLAWFRGAEIEVTKAPSQFAVHGHVDIERSGSDSQMKLPSMDMFKGFGSFFGASSEKKKQGDKPEK